MKILFVTGNSGKLREFSKAFENDEAVLESEDLEIPEIQSRDVAKVTEKKLLAVKDLYSDHPKVKEADIIVVEDTALEIKSMGGLPGPLIKWFLGALKTGGLAAAAEGSSAVAVCSIGYLQKNNPSPHVISGKCPGQITIPRGDEGFGWDSIFQPDGSDKTFAQMTPIEKNLFSHRGKAIELFKSLPVFAA